MATVTSLGFNITAKWDGTGLRAAQLQLDTLKKSLDSINGQGVRIAVDVDDSAARTKLESLRSLVSNQQMTVTVNADTAAATARLTALTQQLDHIAGMHATATASVNTDSGSLTALRAELERFGATRYVAQADVNVDRAHTGLLTLSRDADDSTTHLRSLSGSSGDASGSLLGLGSAGGGASGGVNSVGTAGQGASMSLSGFGTVAMWATGIMVAMGPAAALASAAVLGTLGGAFVGLGALVLSQTSEVKDAFTGLKTSVMNDALQAAEGMKAPLLAGIAELQSGLHELTPAFSQAFTAAGALIKPMVEAFLGFTNNVMPGVIAAVSAATPVFDGLRSGMAQLGSGMSQMFTGMAAGAQGAGAALSIALGGIGKLLGIIGVAFGQMAGEGARALSGLMTGLTGLVGGAMQGFVGAVKAMDGSLGPFLATVGQVAGEILSKMLPVFGQILSVVMTGLIPVFRTLGPVLASVGQVLGTAIVAALKIVMPLIGTLATTFSKVLIALTPLIPPLTVIMIAGLRLLVALITPLLPLLTLMAQLIGKLAPVINVAAIAINALSVGITAAIKWVTDWKNVTQAFSIAWNTVWNGLKIATLAIWDALKVAWNGFVTGLTIAWQTVSGALVTAWNTVWNGIKITGEAIWTGMQVAWNAVVTAFTTVWQTVSGALVTAWNTVWNGISTVASGIWNGMQVAWQTLCSFFASAWSAISGALSQAWSTVWNGMQTAATAVWSFLTGAWQTFVNGLMTILNTFGQVIQTAWSGMWNIIKTAATAVWDFLKTAWQTFVNGLMSILNTFGQTIQNAWSGMWNIIKTAATTVWDFLKSAWQTFVNGLMSILNTFGQTIQKAWSGMWNIIKTAATTVWDFLKSTWQNVVDGLMTILNRFGQTFQKAWSGMWDIVKGVAHEVWVQIATIVQGGVNAAIDVVNGIIKAWDAIVNAVGLKSLNIKAVGHVSIPKFAEGGMVVPVTYAEGGTVPGFHKGGMTFAATHNQTHQNSAFNDFRKGGAIPGYKPGKDTVPAILSPGEGILVPEAVQGLGGAGFVHAANHHFSKGRGGMDVPGFAAGGIAGSVSGTMANIVSSFAVGGTTVPGPGIANPNDPSQNQQKQGAANGTSGDNGNKGTGTSDSISDIISKALGLVVPGGGGDGTVGDIVKGIAHAALGFLGGGTTGTILGFIGEKAISAGFAILGKFADGALKGKFGNVGDVMNAGSHKIIDGLKDYLINQDKQKAKEFAAQAVAGSQSVQAWAPMMAQALQIAGAPASWLGGMLALMQAESGGNPNIFNTTDINARNGTPSGGLMQVIGPTFAAYCQPGFCANLLDPMSNMLASINYIQARYGHVPGSPYATGTPSATPGVHLVGENGPEMVMFGGGETVKNAEDTAAMLNADGTSQPAAAPGASAAAGGVDPQKLAANAAAWKTYMQTIRTTSDTAWKGVKDTASTNWSAMQSGVGPFAGGLAKAVTDAGNAIVGNSKTTWTTARNTAVSAWTDERATGVKFNTDLQKSFADSGTAIQAKWKNDWADSSAVTTKTWADQKLGAQQFSADLQKTYTDMTTAVGTNWKNALTAASNDTTKYWSDTKTQYTQGTSDMQSGFIAPVTTMMTTDLPNAFNASVTAIGTGWENLKTTVREPVAAVVDVVFNQGIVAMWNAIAGTFDAATLDTFTMPGFAVGGAVSGAGTGTSDSITARLSHGEHVWTAAEVAGAGGHANVAALRQAAVGGSPVRGAGGNGRYATGGAVGSTGTVGAPQGGSSAAAAAVPTGADALTAAAGAALGSIKAISNPFIEAAGAAGKEAIAALLPDDVPYKALLNNMTDQMVGTVTSWISANDVAPVFSGGANVAAAQAWADSQVGKPYGLGGDFVNTIDCSQFQSGIARVILGETPAPWFTTFAFVGDTAPAGFEQGLEAPYMVGITNVGVGHMAGTINGKNYEATPPAVRSGPSARGYNDPMFTNQYGFRPSIAAAGGAVTDSNHLAIIDAALSAAGVPPPGTLAAWESGLNTLITRESNWDPNAINNYDSNAAAGTPSQGLAQVIPPTFAAYHVAGTSNNILDPIANVAAAIRYIVSVYGDISNVQQANPNLPPAGYYAGTRGAQAGWHTVGERGPEWVKFRGGEEVLPNGTLPPGGGAGGGVNVSIPITVQGNMDSDAYNRIENELVPKLRRMLEQRRGK